MKDPNAIHGCLGWLGKHLSKRVAPPLCGLCVRVRYRSRVKADKHHLLCATSTHIAARTHRSITQHVRKARYNACPRGWYSRRLRVSMRCDNGTSTRRNHCQALEHCERWQWSHVRHPRVGRWHGVLGRGQQGPVERALIFEWHLRLHCYIARHHHYLVRPCAELLRFCCVAVHHYLVRSDFWPWQRRRAGQ